MRISPKLPLIVLAAILATFAFAATPAMAELKLEKFVLGAQNQDGSPDLQAGSHPYSLTNTFVLNEPGPINGDLKDLRDELPPGFVGDPNATPHCSYQAFIAQECSNEAAIGIATTYIKEVGHSEVSATTDPVYNLVPPAGVPAEFGFVVHALTPVLLDTSVRTGTDYGLTTAVSDLPQAVVIAASKVTIWGDPASPSHNPWRGACENRILGSEANPEALGNGLGEGEVEREGPLYGPGEESEGGGLPQSKDECPSSTPEVPLLTNPTSCNTPRAGTFGVDSWQEPGNFSTGEHVSSKSASLPELVGCEKPNFSPTIAVEPDGKAGSTPTGLTVAVHVPQESTSNPVGVAEADVKDTTVALPAGMQLSPSAADGLQGCAQLHGREEPEKEAQEAKHEILGINLETKWQANCADASKVANVKIKTPLLEGELEGSVFLAAPQNFVGLPENPFSSLFALYLVAEEPKAGVLIKIAGQVTPNPITGQLTTTFENTPQLPFSDLKLEFYGTDRAPLATPALCGGYKTEASLTPWTSPASAPVDPSSSFDIESGPNGSSCTYPGQALPFSPSLVSDTTNVNAGGFTPLDTTLTREDGQQSIQQVTLHYPPGVSGILAGIPLCGEAEANAGTCGTASEIGETIVSVGEGGDPFSVTGGKVYLTGPYHGAPFGLSIVNPAKAGPFDLQEGRPVVVRAKIEVNPLTAALTVTTNTLAEGNAIPTIIDGVPLQIKHVNVNITRQGFTFNPTSCNPTKVEGTVGSAEGASASVSTPFQVTNCTALKFTPKFGVSTTGHTSKAKGAGLTAKVTEPTGALGAQANITRVKVDLPKQLPSQLKTLQKACPAKTFEEGFEKCLEQFKHSKVGEAVVYTPILPVPLKGPAIFVSHGGEAFPSLTIVLQGYGVTVDLVGSTFIHGGITSTTFKAVPDVPFTSFELTLPQGEYAALASNLPEKDKGNLCGQNLKMPTEFLAQNGVKINEDTPIGISGCAKVKALTRSQKLSKALKACRKKGKGKRASCEKAARQKYGAKMKVKSKKK
jgi:hypothetical protein